MVCNLLIKYFQLVFKINRFNFPVWIFIFSYFAYFKINLKRTLVQYVFVFGMKWKEHLTCDVDGTYLFIIKDLFEKHVMEIAAYFF